MNWKSNELKQIVSRKNFLKNLLIISGAAVAVTFIGKKIFNINNKSEGTFSMEDTGIIAIKQLGFQWETRDPFLFCVYHKDAFPKGNESFGPDVSLNGRNIGQDFEPKDGWRMYHGQKIPGFPHHPHRGFETVTVVEKGFVDHSDSLGASGRYGIGDTQWMTAGRGIQHSEMFPLLNNESDNSMELFQIWLNLPAKNKFVEPHFKMLWSEKIPTIAKSDSNGNLTRIKLISGKLGEINSLTPPPNSWALDPNNHVAIWIIEMEPGSLFTLPAIGLGINRSLYFFEGSDLKLNDKEIPAFHGVDVVSHLETNLKNGKSTSKLLLLQGRPIAEPVVQYGPFVMNTKQEIQTAYDDYVKTEFGGWPWKSAEPVHGKMKRRFAKFADGTEESA